MNRLSDWRVMFVRWVMCVVMVGGVGGVGGVGLFVEAEVRRSEGVLGEGTRWATPYYVIDSGVVGETVLVTGGVHGNEPAGAYAADQIRHWPIVKGKLVVVPRVNRLGLEQETRYVPGVEKGERDLNRNFSGVKERGPVRGGLAKLLWAFAEEVEPDWVLDLHEGYEFHVSHEPPKGKKKSVGSTVIYQQGEVLDPIVGEMLGVVNATIEDEGRKFVALKRGPVITGFARASARWLGAQGMILETTSSKQPLSVRTRQHRMMVNVVLKRIGMVKEDCVGVMMGARGDEQVIRVGLYDDLGTGKNGVKNLTQLLGKNSEVKFVHIGGQDCSAEVLKQFDMVLFPGGSGSKQARSLGEGGRAAVRGFVKEGGGFVGICAGAYLGSAHYKWSLHLTDTHVLTGVMEVEGVGKKQMWYRGGSSMVKMEMTEKGKAVFGEMPKVVDVRYQNGPIVWRKKDDGIQDYEVLAWFRSEKVRYPPQKGTMVNTPAIISSGFEKGRVLTISPHPEATKGLEKMIDGAVKWVVKRK